jgi:hypothetical protein
MSNEPSGVGKRAGKGPGSPHADTGDRGRPTFYFFGNRGLRNVLDCISRFGELTSRDQYLNGWLKVSA